MNTIDTSVMSGSSLSTGRHLPAQLVWGVLFVCLLPTVLNLLGVDFGVVSPSVDWASISPEQRSEAMFHSLKGSFIHTLLEWTAVCIATLTVILAFLHFNLKKEPAIPILAMALFSAGCVDAFHTLATDRLFQAVVADNDVLIPFTWAISRLFNALIKCAGVGLFLTVFRREKRELSLSAMLILCAVFALTSFLVIAYCAQSRSLPVVSFPESWITRPYDLVSMLLYVFGAGLFWTYFRRETGYFAHALLIGCRRWTRRGPVLLVSMGSRARFCRLRWGPLAA